MNGRRNKGAYTTAPYAMRPTIAPLKNISGKINNETNALILNFLINFKKPIAPIQYKKITWPVMALTIPTIGDNRAKGEKIKSGSPRKKYDPKTLVVLPGLIGTSEKYGRLPFNKLEPRTCK